LKLCIESQEDRPGWGGMRREGNVGAAFGYNGWVGRELCDGGFEGIHVGVLKYVHLVLACPRKDIPS
jgi:hypothetical protein